MIESREREKTKINKQMATSELRALRAQLNPHFLFNSLNTLTGLVEEKSDNAPRFVEELSKFYRYSFQHSEKEFTALEMELKQVEGYLFMLRIRFEDHLKVEWKIAERHMEYLISTHSLQLLFENITKHNVVSAERPLWISVSTTNEDTLIVKNQLQAKK